MSARWLPVLGLCVLGAAVRALGFVGPLYWTGAGDEARHPPQALEILRGSLPVHQLGAEYAGASPAYPLAAWFALVGPSPLALDLFSYAVGLATLWTGYCVARRVLPPVPACLALAVWAVPPWLLARWSLAGILDYPFLLLLGNLLLLVTHALFFGAERRARTLLVLGFLTGVALWTQLLSLVYLAPALFLAVRTGLAWRPRAWLFPAAALLGALPAGLYELQHFPSTRFVVHRFGIPGAYPLGERVAIVMGGFLPELLGVDPRRIGLTPGGLLALVVLGLGVVALIRAAVRDRGELAWVLGLGSEQGTGRSLLWVVTVTNVALVIFTDRGIHGDHYVLPLYSVLACWIGETLHWLWRCRRGVGAAAAVAFFALQLGANWTATAGHPSAAGRWARLTRPLEPLLPWLDARGIHRVYWEARPNPFEVTYLSGMRVVAASPWREQALRDSHLVDAETAPPFVLDPTTPSLQESLLGIGMDVRESLVGGYRVLEARPAFATGFAPLPPRDWRVTASDNAEAASNLLDRDASTGWSTGSPQKPGQWLAVDLGTEQDVTRIDLLAIDSEEVPVGFRVDVSREAAGWREVVSVPNYRGPLFFSEQHAFLKVRRGRVQAIFPPVRARFIRIVQTGAHPDHAWGARELFVYRPAPLRSAPRPEPIIAGLRRNGVRFVYANHWLSAWVQVESGGAIGALESNRQVNSYGRDTPEPEYLSPFPVRAGDAILVGSDADAGEIRATLAAHSVVVRESEAGPYRLLVFSPGGPSPQRLPKDGWTATASENPEQARLAVDGSHRTRWTSASPAGEAVRFTLDLGAVHRIRRVRLTPGTRATGMLDLRLDGSRDGTAWFPLGSLAWTGPLYWSGSELLRNGSRGWAVAFPPTDIRYLRLSPTRSVGAPWVIGEIDCYE